jgi:hypothetical protein
MIVHGVLKLCVSVNADVEPQAHSQVVTYFVGESEVDLDTHVAVDVDINLIS